MSDETTNQPSEDDATENAEQSAAEAPEAVAAGESSDTTEDETAARVAVAEEQAETEREYGDSTVWIESFQGTILDTNTAIKVKRQKSGLKMLIGAKADGNIYSAGVILPFLTGLHVDKSLGIESIAIGHCPDGVNASPQERHNVIEADSPANARFLFESMIMGSTTHEPSSSLFFSGPDLVSRFTATEDRLEAIELAVNNLRTHTYSPSYGCVPYSGSILAVMSERMRKRNAIIAKEKGTPRKPTKEIYTFSDGRIFRNAKDIDKVDQSIDFREFARLIETRLEDEWEMTILSNPMALGMHASVLCYGEWNDGQVRSDDDGALKYSPEAQNEQVLHKLENGSGAVITLLDGDRGELTCVDTVDELVSIMDAAVKSNVNEVVESSQSVLVENVVDVFNRVNSLAGDLKEAGLSEDLREAVASTWTGLNPDPSVYKVTVIDDSPTVSGVQRLADDLDDDEDDDTSDWDDDSDLSTAAGDLDDDDEDLEGEDDDDEDEFVDQTDESELTPDVKPKVRHQKVDGGLTALREKLDN